MCFSALQRAEIAEIQRPSRRTHTDRCRFSALQRAEIAEISIRRRSRSRGGSVSVLFNEPKLLKLTLGAFSSINNEGFSALQRAEIAEIELPDAHIVPVATVSVLFNEPKLLKYIRHLTTPASSSRFSALQRAEIAEMVTLMVVGFAFWRFQCSSTSRNC